MSQTPSDEQLRVLSHPPDRHGRLLAGPGTGKSATVLELAARLLNFAPPVAVKVITFTRAATAELAKKIRDEGGADVEPGTVHSFALSVLMRNRKLGIVPLPLRVPDEWEASKLIHPDIALRLRAKGFEITVGKVKKLEQEMSARWESLDPDKVLLADLQPALRNAYIQCWQEQRKVFGYCLFAEMTHAAACVLEDHPDARLPAVDFLIVDEFQDLNRADIKMIECLASRGIKVFGVGDDDQSLYSFRMAAPAGIRELANRLDPLDDYTLSISFRCGKQILKVARDLIETSPGRPLKPALMPGEKNPDGLIKYLKFSDEEAERKGVASIVKHLIEQAMAPKDIVILLRSDYRGSWSKPVKAMLDRAGIEFVDVEAACEALQSNEARRILAVARLIGSPNDGLSWWTYLNQTSGVSEEYVRRVADEALSSGEGFASRVRRCIDCPPSGATSRSQNAACGAIRDLEQILSLHEAQPQEPAGGWPTWICSLAASAGMSMPQDLSELMVRVSEVLPKGSELDFFIQELEPTAKDLALQTNKVSIMTITRSKGLTFKAAIIMGVEDGVIPSQRDGADEEEERRILYVGVTRAREFCLLTMAQSRHDGTAMSSGGEMNTTRSRSRFLDVIAVSPEDGEAYVSSLTSLTESVELEGKDARRSAVDVA